MNDKTKLFLGSERHFAIVISYKMTTTQKLVQQFEKPVVIGATGYLVAMAMGKDSLGPAPLPLIGTSVSPSVLYALLAAGSSFAAEILANWILPMLPKNSAEMVRLEQAVAAPVMNGLVNVAAIKFLYPEYDTQDSLLQPFVIGALSEALGTYVHDNFVQQWIQKYL